MRVNANFCSHFNLILAVQPSQQKYSILYSPQISGFISLSRLVERGVRVVTNVEVGCGGRVGDSRRLTHTRTAKPCGPGAPTLALSERNDPLMTGAKEPGPRGELGVSR